MAASESQVAMPGKKHIRTTARGSSARRTACTAMQSRRPQANDGSGRLRGILQARTTGNFMPQIAHCLRPLRLGLLTPVQLRQPKASQHNIWSRRPQERRLQSQHLRSFSTLQLCALIPQHPKARQEFRARHESLRSASRAPYLGKLDSGLAHVICHHGSS